MFGFIIVGINLQSSLVIFDCSLLTVIIKENVSDGFPGFCVLGVDSKGFFEGISGLFEVASFEVNGAHLVVGLGVVGFGVDYCLVALFCGIEVVETVLVDLSESEIGLDVFGFYGEAVAEVFFRFFYVALHGKDCCVFD